ncbi:cell wall hydrolase [Rhodospirillaceae bacterium SYSU D60014]|uniref:cell wall hydrolase n=1 Tax=Virgifigura deserti TaxID=2268457 RepID=UPI000E6672CD
MNVFRAIGDTLHSASRSVFPRLALPRLVLPRLVIAGRSRQSAAFAGCLALITGGLALIPGPDAAAIATVEEGQALAAVAPGAGGFGAQSTAALALTPDLRHAAGGANTLATIGREVECLALNIYFEARSEPETGKRAVAHVVMNRVADPRFPDDVCAVVQQGGEWPRHRCQFSWWCDGQSDEPTDRRAWVRSKALAQQVYWARSADPTNGALWYHADYVAPSWGQVLAQAGKIGRHIFYLDQKKPKLQLASS